MLTSLSQCTSRCLLRYFKAVLNSQTGKLGRVTAIQTFGDYGRWHPHLHLSVTNSMFMQNGSFHIMSNVCFRLFQELFRALILRMLEWESKINRPDEKGREALAQYQYLIRNPFLLEKIKYNAITGMAIYVS